MFPTKCTSEILGQINNIEIDTTTVIFHQMLLPKYTDHVDIRQTEIVSNQKLHQFFRKIN